MPARNSIAVSGSMAITPRSYRRHAPGSRKERNKPRSLAAGRDLRREFLSKLLQLGSHHKSAVWLPPMVAEVVLVIVFSAVESLRRAHLGHDRAAPDAFRVQFANRLFCRRLLFGTVIEN